MMDLAIPKKEILKLLKKQLNTFFVLNTQEAKLLDDNYENVLEKCKHCFQKNKNKYYCQNGKAYFNPFHSVQYMTFLYFFSNILYHNYTKSTLLCDKLYYLNKTLNAVDLFYAVDLPDFFMAEHPVGSVIGRAEIGNGFSFFQGCTVGGVKHGELLIYPIIGNNVHLYANSAIIGACNIGNNVNIGAGTLVKNQDVPDDSNVFGHSPNLVIKSKK